MKTNLPIFIIKYRIAPQNKFPAAINDVINGYLSVLHTFAGKVKRVLMMGDSAGGNIVLSLTNFLIMNQLPVPTQLFLIYPGQLISGHCLQKILCA